MKTGPVDRKFAEIVRTRRETAGLSQSRLADLMTGYGFPWRQQTVTPVENGERSVNIGEAAALAVILHLDAELSVLGARNCRSFAAPAWVTRPPGSPATRAEGQGHDGRRGVLRGRGGGEHPRS